MPNLPRLVLVLVCALLLGRPTSAQEVQSNQPAATTPLVTAAVAGEWVRFAAPGGVVQLRLEVYNEGGQKVFDTELRGGNVLDWHFKDGQGERVTTGAYACVLTVKSLAGRLSQKLSTVTVAADAAVVQATLATQLSAAQAQAIGPVEDDAPLAVLRADEAVPASAVVAHDGVSGQLTRTRGALRFTVGDFFSGLEREQMRLTAAGDLGLGTTKPQAKLDVVGDIRATGQLHAAQGIEFADGTVQTTGLSGVKDKDGNIIPAAAGTGTVGRHAKWTETGGAGTLGDSLLADVGTNVVNTGTNIQMTAPASNNVDTNLIFTNANDRTTGMIASSSPAFTAANGPYFAMRGNTYSAIGGQRGLFSISTGNVANPVGNEGSVVFLTGADQLRMSIKPNGNVGIGTSNPANKLVIASGGSGGEVNFGTPNGETGMAIIGTNRADVRFDGSTLKLLAGTGVTSPASGIAIDTAGNVGIGTFAPQNKLVVNAGGSGGAVNFGTPSGESGLAIIGTNRGDVRFDGSTLKLLAGTGPGAMASTNGIAIDTGGNVGIGTTSPTARLQVVGGSGTGVRGDGATGVDGTSTSTSGFGVYGASTSATGYGVFATNPTGLALGVAGNASQNLNNGGLVKAMLYVSETGNVLNCYNSQRQDGGAGLPPSGATGCGFTVTHPSVGHQTINFGFTINTRFFSVTGISSLDVGGCIGPDIGVDSFSGNNVSVVTACGSFSDNRFMIVVY